MKSTLSFVFAVCMFAVCTAQNDTQLAGYLQTHRYAISLNDSNAFTMLPGLMGSHNVLIHGEGASHNLKLYDTLQLALRRQLVRQHLKVALIEYGRDIAFLFTKYLEGDTTIATLLQPSSLVPYQPFRGWIPFRTAGIDFERAGSFHLAVNSVLRGIDKEQLATTGDFVAMISGNGYLGFSEKEFIAFYKKCATAFKAQDAALRNELGEHYEELKYLCSNTNVTRRTEDRNPALARNFIYEVTPFDTTATYYCEIGNAHSKTNDRGSMAAILSKEPVLKNRLIVMNTYCYHCGTDEGPTEEVFNRMDYMKGDRLKLFRDACIGNITLFDLSGLMGPDAFLKDSGTLLLFVKDYH